MAVTGTPYSGVEGRVTVEGVILNLAKWDVEVNAPNQKTTNFEGGGYAERVRGVADATIRVSGFWDGTTNPHQDPPNLISAAIVGPVILFVSTVDGIFWYFEQAYVEKIHVMNDVEGKVEFEATLLSDGPFTYPDAVVTTLRP